MKTPRALDFRRFELDSTYADRQDRFVVSLIVTCDPARDAVKSPAEAVKAALQLTRDEGSHDTQWYCYDRKTKQMHMIEQEKVDE